MKAIQGKGKKAQNRLQRQRNGLLAKVHIAKKELGLMEDDYRDILQCEFGVKSSSALSVKELQSLVRRFERKGWKPDTSREKAVGSKHPPSLSELRRGKDKGQAEALRERAREMAAELENGEKRLRGLVRKICGVEQLEWCGDGVRLKRLLAALGNIVEGQHAA